MAASKRYGFRVNETRYPKLSAWLESLPEGDKSYWIIETLSKGLGIEEEKSPELTVEVTGKRPDRK